MRYGRCKEKVFLERFCVGNFGEGKGENGGVDFECIMNNWWFV